MATLGKLLRLVSLSLEVFLIVVTKDLSASEIEETAEAPRVSSRPCGKLARVPLRLTAASSS